MLARVPNTSALWYPNESCFVADFWDYSRQNIEIANPIKSDSKWAVSEKMAIEFERIPPAV